MRKMWVRTFWLMASGTRKKTGVTDTGLLSVKLPDVSRDGVKLLHALLAEASAGRRALTSLELGVALADHVERALALHDLAISVTALHGGE